jgi:hypothetical protein
MTTTRTIYELDAKTREANGRVYFFCSDACRENFARDWRADDDDTIRLYLGETTDAIAGTVCDRCGVLV